MTRLLILHHGQKFMEVDLSLKSQWIIGRSVDSDIVLDKDRGISRQHLKLSLENGNWLVEVLSRYGELYQKGKKIQLMHLKNRTQFEVPPFEFLFEVGNELSQSEVLDLSERVNESENIFPKSENSFSDRTQVGISRIVAFVKACNHEHQEVQTFRLEGHVWTAGRETSCAVFVDNQKFSRRHFEIRLEDRTYMIRDLGSSNGTSLNGQKLIPDRWMPIASGDVIVVVDWHLYFELRDANFEGKLKQFSNEFLPIVSENYEILAPPSPTSVIQAPAKGIGALTEQLAKLSPRNKSNGKMNWVRLATYLVIIGGGGSYILSGPATTEDGKDLSSRQPVTSPIAKLKPEQQQYVKDTYRLADRLFKEGRYEMARQEVAKIHALIPFYEESKNLEKLSDVAIQTQIEQQHAEVIEKEKAEMEEKIETAVAICEKKVNPKVEMKFVDDCLADVMSLDPEHPSILRLKAQVDQMISERTVRHQRAGEMEALIRKQKLIFQTASKKVAAGHPLEAIADLNTVIASNHPDPKNYKQEAKRQVASIQKKMSEQQGVLEKEADLAYKKNDLKGSIISLKKALEINPENETIKGRINSVIAELKKQMQNLYQEGILEESVGEVETAKAKWKKIVESSVPEEDYYKKARTKLKKYGIE